MAITLESIPAPGATPIANNSASAKAFANNYFKLHTPNISMRERKTITILAMVNILASSGADYRNNHAGLMQDAQVYTGGLSMMDVWAAVAGTSVGAAHDADATFPLDLDALTALGRDIANKSEDELDRMFAFLAAQLGL